jgi:hypothetical protein
MKKYITQVVTVDHARYDTDTYNMLFDKIHIIEQHLDTNEDSDEWEYKEILKRERRGNQSIYYVLFKKN